MEIRDVLIVLNSVATRYETSKNLIKACRKELVDKVDIVAVEETGRGYRRVICFDLEKGKKFDLKLFETEDGVYFDTYDKPQSDNFIEMLEEEKKDSKTEFAKGYNAGIEKAKLVFMRYLRNKITAELMEDDDEDDEE